MRLRDSSKHRRFERGGAPAGMRLARAAAEPAQFSDNPAIWSSRYEVLSRDAHHRSLRRSPIISAPSGNKASLAGLSIRLGPHEACKRLMDRLRDYSLLALMSVASRSAAYTGPERRKEDRGIGARAAGNDNAHAMCGKRARYTIAAQSIGEAAARLKPVTVGLDPMGRPVVVPYIADGASPDDWPAPARLEPRAAGGACPDFASTVILPASAGPGGAA